MRKILIAIVFVLGIAFSALGQTSAPPNFSGKWTLNAGKSTLPKDSTIKTETVDIENKKSAIVFHFKTDGKKSTETYTPDGKKRVTKDLQSGDLIASASWHDSVLVIESTLAIKIPGVVVNVSGLKPVVDTWAMAADSKTLTHEANDHKEIYIYEKM